MDAFKWTLNTPPKSDFNEFKQDVPVHHVPVNHIAVWF